MSSSTKQASISFEGRRPHVDASTTSPVPPDSLHRTARVIGVIYLAGMVLGILGKILIQSLVGAPDHLAAIASNTTLLMTGVVMWLVTVAGDAAHGVVMYPLLKPGGERLAVAYLAARIIDAVIVAIMALVIALQVPLALEYTKGGPASATYLEALSAVLTHGSAYAYEIGMMSLGVAGLVLCSAFLRTALIPRWLAVWGLVGYAALLVGSVLQILGLELNSMQTVIGGLWEVFIGVWLIVKGFRNPR